MNLHLTPQDVKMIDLLPEKERKLHEHSLIVYLHGKEILDDR